MERIAYYEGLLSDRVKLLAVVREELIEIRDRFGDERKTEIIDNPEEVDIEDLIEEQESVFTMTRMGYIKRMPATAYKAQRRGGRGVTGMQTRDEDVVETIFTASTHEIILFFTNKGRVHRLKGYQIPESSRTAKGMNIVNLLQLGEDERVQAGIHIREFNDEDYIMFVTRKGEAKRIQLSMLNTASKAGVKAINLDEDDELVAVMHTHGNDTIFIASHAGQAVCFGEEEVRPTGREAGGVRGIKLRDGDYVVGAGKASDGKYVLTVTENGFGKMTECEEFREAHRGTMGVRVHNLTEKTGDLCSLKVVDGSEDMIIINSQGVVIRTSVQGVRICARASQGVYLIRLEEDVKVISVTTTTREEDEDGENTVDNVEKSVETVENSTENAENPQ